MDLFGLKEHEQQHKDVERHVRRLVEQVAELTIDLGETRMQLRKLGLEVDSKVSADEIDPALVAINAGIKSARTELQSAQEAADETWDEVSDDLADAVGKLREQFAEQ